MQRKNKIIMWLVVIALLALIGKSVYSYYFTPGRYDEFAKCLTDKDAVMYGAIRSCKYTQAQAAMFGKSFNYVNYKEATELPGIKVTPTWVIGGKRYERVQSFDNLASITGCSYAK